MDAETMEIARRLVGCKRWKWLRGMNTQAHGVVCGVDGADAWCADGAGTHCGIWLTSALLPDLDDDMTRLGVLAVVRQAWEDQTMHVRIVDAWNAYGEHRGWKYVWCSASEYLTAEIGEHRSELAAMLAALEAAP